ncbi:DinB family protein [Bacillus atrophaeus]|uniref:DinB family protein n=1 Tax=Bacillus atrophaeus TaxID=1452 RepID=UPI0007C468E6|nr:DinB family protein [Bacillus atrophaeus]WFE16121.1 DinB family protein [Bacillus atrophaeus]
MKDLAIRDDMAPTVSLLYSAAEENMTRLFSIVNHMTLEQLDYKGRSKTKNSTAQLLHHIANVDMRWVWRIKENRIPEHIIKLYGPMISENGCLPEVKGQPLHYYLNRLQHVLTELRDVCVTLKEADVNRELSYDKDTATIRWGIWHMADHNRYHQAHIEALKAEWRKDITENAL